MLEGNEMENTGNISRFIAAFVERACGGLHIATLTYFKDVCGVNAECTWI